MERTALVTGGTRGIGGEISRALKEAGYLVAANYHNEIAAAEKFHQETGIPIFSWDISNFNSCEKGIADVCETLGGTIDILVNNAGITRDCMLHKMNLEDWTKVLEINLNSVFHMCRSIIPAMRDKKYGRIINISSINGLRGQAGQSNYCAAKAGIIGFTKALALESAPKGITVNAIAPGYIDTAMTVSLHGDLRERIQSEIPVGRFGKIDEIAHAVLFLADERSSFITGTVLNINGGQYL
ncbi:MAG: beta-ketoacyl-ACP reductase [Holosporaceae bacterium]|jgi:acetoacetyl-CoA reductase|nr:beta-ketoacyl-ACP reductase [Holosporaceae bacterium]